MITATIIAVILGLAMTAWITRRVRGRTVKAEWVAPLWGVGGCAVILGGSLLWYAVTLRSYDQCIETATRSRGSHTLFEALFDRIDDATHTDNYTVDLRVKLNKELPVIEVSHCRHP